MLKMENIRKTYMNNNIQIEVLRGIDLEIQSGEMVAIMGASGSGKSTLLGIMGGLEQATVGTYQVDDTNIDKMTEKDLKYFRNKKMGLVFQKFYLLPSKTVKENVIVPMYYDKGIKKKEYEKRAMEVLECVHMGHRLDFTPGKLSGGECQRVAIARAIVNEPEILLADEPTGNLDSRTSKEIMQLLCTLHEKSHNTAIIVTHDNEIAKMCDRKLLVKDGRIMK